MDTQFAIIVEEGAAGDGSLARWPPLLTDASAPFSTFQGRRALSPLSSGPNDGLIDSLHTSTRQQLNQDGHDWVLVSIFGVAVGNQDPQPTLVIVLRPGGASAAGAKLLVNQIVELQGSLGIDPAFAVEILSSNQDYRQMDELATSVFPRLPRLGASVGLASSAAYEILGF
ncbi:hypothetical protein B0T14DRAFT_493868 [Immersiella caudata]|uniref:Uncharacterized protein n=1 Tax=Immersiella caudata TaxID=314043 RepID=A0AA39X5T6_9PEZI|nr:hypothetical protein B0T14DRAFT_493868 [Immersiella caudata]